MRGTEMPCPRPSGGSQSREVTPALPVPPRQGRDVATSASCRATVRSFREGLPPPPRAVSAQVCGE